MKGPELLKALRENKLVPSLVLTGMVKVDEGETNVILFSPRGCETWIPIPVGVIEDVKVIGKMKCKDHTHDRVTLTLKESQGSEEAVYCNLLRVYAVRATDECQDYRDCLSEGGDALACCNLYPDCCHRLLLAAASAQRQQAHLLQHNEAAGFGPLPRQSQTRLLRSGGMPLLASGCTGCLYGGVLYARGAARCDGGHRYVCDYEVGEYLWQDYGPGSC
jgi:hypothetical protein